MPPIIISIDGNIGSGKSTLIDILKCHYKGDVVVLEEPVDKWKDISDDKSGENIITKFYKNKNKYSFSFQMLALITRINLIRNIIKNNPDIMIVAERSIMSDKSIFCDMMYDEGYISEIDYKVYLTLYNEFIKELPISGVIYLNTTPKTCFRRILTRDRKGEDISLDYLTKCNNYHDKWLKSSKTMFIKLNGDDNVYKNPLIVRKWIKEISCFLETFSVNENEKRIFKYYNNFPYETYIKEILSNKRNEEE